MHLPPSRHASAIPYPPALLPTCLHAASLIARRAQTLTLIAAVAVTALGHELLHLLPPPPNLYAPVTRVLVAVGRASACGAWTRTINAPSAQSLQSAAACVAEIMIRASIVTTPFPRSCSPSSREMRSAPKMQHAPRRRYAEGSQANGDRARWSQLPSLTCKRRTLPPSLTTEPMRKASGSTPL